MPSIENLKKRAKQYLRWHRERHYPVATEIRTALPRYRDMTDAEILSAPFSLRDAQTLIARKQGFRSWEELLKGLNSMTEQNDGSGNEIGPLSSEPMIFVSNIEAACDFYVGKLGFEIAFTYGKPPFYGQVFRGNAKLNLRCVGLPLIDPVRAAAEDLAAAAITLNDAKPLFLEYQATGVTFHQLLRTEPWGARTFIVRDPDGNLILFAGRGSGPP